jgi:hypothetical protein
MTSLRYQFFSQILPQGAAGKYISAIALLTFFLTSCTRETKLVQCTKLIENVNEANISLNSQKLKTDAIASQKLGQQLEKRAIELDLMTFKDVKLTEFSKNLAQGFRDLSPSIKDLSQSVEKGQKIEITTPGREEFNKVKEHTSQAGKTAQKIAQKQDKLLEELNLYCNTKEK